MSRDLSIHPQSVASPPTSPSPSVPARRSLLGHSSAPGALVDDARADTARALRRALRRAGAADARGAVAVAVAAEEPRLVGALLVDGFERGVAVLGDGARGLAHALLEGGVLRARGDAAARERRQPRALRVGPADGLGLVALAEALEDAALHAPDPALDPLGLAGAGAHRALAQSVVDGARRVGAVAPLAPPARERQLAQGRVVRRRVLELEGLVAQGRLDHDERVDGGHVRG